LITVIALAAGTLRADIIHLATGQNVQGRFLGYADSSFEVADENGKATKYPLTSVRTLDLEKGSIPVTIKLRNAGQIPGKLLLFEHSAFSIEYSTGQIAGLPVAMVDSLAPGSAPTPTPVRVTPKPVAPATPMPSHAPAATGSSESVKVITHGDRVDIAQHLVRGKVNIVDFYADWCGPCRAVAPQLEKIVADDKDVVVRKIDIVKWGSPVATQYNINSIPRIDVYDGNGKYVGSGRGTSLVQLINQAKSATK